MIKQIWKPIFSILLCTLMLFHSSINLSAEQDHSKTNQTKSAELDISSPSVCLMETNTGTICYAKNENQSLPMASVTKVMTLLLIFEALDAKQIALDQSVSISEHAASMGGSQVFLEPGEIQTVETLIKCISIASANDGSVALAETVAGSEEAFVERMNQKAGDLHMENTHFVNCCGLDAPNHHSSAKDLAIVSRELITKHPEIFDYCTIWQEDITHQTKKGATPFTLTNTNKLLKQYPYATGLKTGSTSVAKYCLSATAKKDHLSFIAVIMAAPTPKDRFKDALTLLEYGFNSTGFYTDSIKEATYPVKITKGVKDKIDASPEHDFTFLALKGENLSQIKKKEMVKKELQAPIKKGTVVGKISYYIGDNCIGSVSLVANTGVKKATYPYYLWDISRQYFISDKKSGK